MFGFKVNRFVNLLSREYVVTDGYVIDKNTLQFVCLRTKDLVFLEGFKVVHVEVANDWFLTVTVDRLLSFIQR